MDILDFFQYAYLYFISLYVCKNGYKKRLLFFIILNSIQVHVYLGKSFKSII